MRRREFTTLLASAAAWSLSAHAQQPTRRIGVLIGDTSSDPEAQARVTAFRKGLRELGWTDGANVRIDYRWGNGDGERIRTYAAELVGLAPDVILAYAPQVLAALREETRSVPIVFVQITDPITGGFVASLARPGGNITGFTNFEFTIGGKWLGVLKEIVPGVTRVLVILNSRNPTSVGFVGAIEATASSLGVQLTRADVRTAAEMESAIQAFASQPNGGVIVLPDVNTNVHRELIVALAARHRVPAIYPFRPFAMSGGLMSYGVDRLDQSRRAASYVDRILRGAKPGELPVQAPTKFEFVINLKTAKTLGLEVPPGLSARADEVIE